MEPANRHWDFLGFSWDICLDSGFHGDFTRTFRRISMGNFTGFDGDEWDLTRKTMVIEVDLTRKVMMI